MSIDERHHRSRTQATSPAISRPGWIESQDHPRRRRSYAKRVTRSTPIHRAKTSSVTAVKVKVKSSLRQGPGGWEIVDRSQGHGRGAGYGRLCSCGLQCSHGHGGFRPVVRGTFEQFKTRLLRVVGRKRLGGEGSIRLRRPPCCPRCLLRARAAVRTVQERRAHEFRPSDYEKGTRHPSINPIGGEEYLRSDRLRR